MNELTKLDIDLSDPGAIDEQIIEQATELLRTGDCIATANTVAQSRTPRC